jgi:hypothetical protein
MLPPGPNSAIEEIVTELAALHAADSAAILRSLTEAEREIVEKFLGTHIGQFEVSFTNANATSVSNDLQLSTLLTERLRAAAGGDASMTATARQALQDCVATLHRARKG